MRVKATASIFFMASLLSGCASNATGPEFSKTKYYSSNTEPDKSRVYIFRKPAGMLAAGRSTKISLDNKPIAKCDINGFVALDISPGEHIISAELPDTAGKCSIKLNAEKEKTYFFEVKPRKLNSGVMIAGVLGGAIGATIADNAVNSGLTCGGSFSIEPVEQDYGKNSLISSHLSQ